MNSNSTIHVNCPSCHALLEIPSHVRNFQVYHEPILTAALSTQSCNGIHPLDPTPSQASQTSIANNAYALFQMVDINKNGFLDCQELQAALSSGGISFSLQTVNILLAKHDRERNGQLGFEEFKSLLDEVWKWKVEFGYDFESRMLLITLIPIKNRIQLSPSTFQTVFFSSDIDRSGSIQLDQFIKLVTELQLGQIRFNALDTQKANKIELTYDAFIDLLFSIRS
ncbi:programmed cell death protein [Blastocystis sp. subtype 4]|uniref:programmed cell death protein n=1 Tax=Blastocystis sp. subtype 4 TaxID=944170 RepID=UPI0007114943|nr:programmed cell death protein [Blastocystis sp. subtype 4]KNB42228.1 programmed cell death protein [Blastocystis sp. subtype 4]|eukprot:XP_014525671.1 programmed cell death protein [Blastocystis sp. subtype 4]